ncbi:hypothetical protein AB5J62_23375 [Amycolatopsis sp. cg5]|uniref:hypothetical protein n=1 Tax=Amycolatopsis sp. cg5 TaxID=3238802 RepID=UPI00352691D9
MLSLSPPFYTIEGVVVGRDFTDPTQFWYFPNRPHLALDEHGRPAVRLLVYKENLDELPPEKEDAAAFLVFDTTLDWPKSTLDKVAAKIRQDLDLDVEPRLTPLLYRSGRARLTFLDRRSQQPGENPAEEPDKDWVTVLEATATPSLYGENRAIFSVMLTKKAAALVLASFDGFLPAGVTYELDYPAMQRTFNVHVEADWSLVYSYIREYQKDRHFFSSEEVEKITEKLLDTKLVKITGTVEGVDEEAMLAEFNEVRKQLAQFVWEKFFEPKPNPQELLDRDVPDSIIGFLGGMRDMLLLPKGFVSSKRTLDVEQIRKLDIDYTVNRAVQRTIAPQAHLSMFWQDFQPPLNRDQVITVVRGDDDLWRQVKFEVLASADFAEDAVQRIIVDVAYGPMGADGPTAQARRWSLVLDNAHQKGEVAGWFDPAVGTTFHYRYTVAFGPNAIVGDDVLLTSPWREASSGALTVNPAELYKEHRIDFIRLSNLRADLFPEVLVGIKYRDPGTGWSFQDSALVTGQSPKWTPVFRSRKGAPDDVEYRLDYKRSDTAGTTPPVLGKTASDLVPLDDPRPNLFTVNVSLIEPGKVERLFLSLEYSDEEHGIYESTTLTFDKNNLGALRWSFPRAVRDRDRYRYSQTLIATDGTVLETGWVETNRSTLLVGNKFAALWDVEPELTGPPLTDNGVQKITVTLAYDDEANNYHPKSVQDFTAPGRGQKWSLQLKNPNARAYTVTVEYLMRNGFSRFRGPYTASDSFLMLSTVPPQ